MKRRILKTASYAAKALCGCALVACSPPATVATANQADAADSTQTGAGFDPGSCAETSTLETELFGSIRGKLSWDPPQDCAGMERPPEVGGVRLRYSGLGPRGEQLVVVLGLDPVDVGNEIVANVTLIVEDEGQFFSNQQQTETCWARVDRYDPPDAEPPRVIRGLAWCVTPLPSVAGPGEVRIGDIVFAGFVPWPRGDVS